MKTFLAIILYGLSLFGIDVGSKVRIDHIQDKGTNVLLSKIVSEPGGTRFECVRSASGQCYYTVFPDRCTSATDQPADCLSRPVQQFALAGGGSRRVASLHVSSVCVSADAKTKGPACD